MNMVSPVTEPEMRSFASRLVSMIVAHSTQAQEIKSLQDQMDDQRARMDQLRTDSENLSRQLAEAWQLVEAAEKERDAAKAEAERAKAQVVETNNLHRAVVGDYEDRLGRVHDALAQRDARIAELEQQLAVSTAETAALDTKLEVMTRDLDAARIDTKYWSDRAHNAETEVVSWKGRFEQEQTNRQRAEDRLAEVQTKLNDLHALFQPAPVQAVA